MLQLVRTEWLKIRKYRAFWVVMGITALSYPGIIYMFHEIYKELVAKKDAAGQLANALLGQPFAFPEVFRVTAFGSSMFLFIPAIVVIMLISNEYTYKTSRQNIIDGWSRNQFMMAKLLDVVMITLIITALYTVVTLAVGFANVSPPGVNRFSMVHYIGLFAFQTFAQLSLAFLVGLIVRKAFIGLGIFVFYFIIVENIAVLYLKEAPAKDSIWYDIGRFFPLEVADRMIPRPAFIGRFDEKAYQLSLDAVPTYVAYTCVLVLVLWSLNFWIYKKRDL